MIHLFVIADDFTGALDTGVQFASYGAATKVIVGTGLQALEADAQTQVLVVDAETRHLPAAQAYDTVYRLVRWAKDKKIGCIYKKTDSALRGNLGAELSAALTQTLEQMQYEGTTGRILEKYGVDAQKAMGGDENA